MRKQHLLFAKEFIARRKPIKRMRVYDCGHEMVLMKCDHCGHDNGWQSHLGNSITDLKRGWPCPKCNETELAPTATQGGANSIMRQKISKKSKGNQSHQQGVNEK